MSNIIANVLGSQSNSSSLVFRSLIDIVNYINRVNDEGGEIVNNTHTNLLLRGLLNEGLLNDDTVLLFDANMGMIQRTDGVLKFVRTAFDASDNDNDLDGSATASQQPRLVGGIAPNSKPAANNQSGESRSFSHTSITVSGTYTTVKMIDTSGKYEFEYTEVTSGTLSTVTWTGNLRMYMIYAGTLSAAERTSLEASLYGLYPEIESVDIGTQTWATRNFEAVATPLGNVIANVTENGAVEKITNAADREFSSDTGFWNKSAGCTIEDGVGRITERGAGGGFFKNAQITTGKWYKVTYTILNYVKGVLRVSTGGSILATNKSANGTYTDYVKATGGQIGFLAFDTTGNTTLDIDNVSFEELNWSNATEIYDAVYAATAGTAAEKEYAALKEASMWCYYNNDVNNGAIYGKLYNWYAAKLLDLDMATAGFGYQITQDVDWDDLEPNELDNSIKYTGEDYWEEGNEGTNETGLTVLGSGFRYLDGEFVEQKETAIFWNSDETIEDKRIGGNIRIKQV